MKSEQAIKNKMKRIISMCKNSNNEERITRLECKAELLAWVLEMEDDEFYDFWDKVERG